MMKAHYFITGTDTNCGKTFVTKALLKWFHKQNQTAHAIKPIASGETKQGERYINDDVCQLEASTAFVQLPINKISLKEPIAPHLAARHQKTDIHIDDLIQFCKQSVFQDIDHLLIEGAGGLMVPLNEQESWLDFLKKAQIPIILVVGMRLGCLNHALLSEKVLEHEELICKGWIANCLDANMLCLDENIETLQSWLKMPYLGKVGFQGEFFGSKLLF